MEKRFRALHIVAGIFKIIAWITLVIGGLGGCLTIAVGGLLFVGGASARDASTALGITSGIGGVATGIGIIIAVAIYFLFIYAFGELIYLLIALEENTRATADKLASLSKS